jgi:V/A-type H+/Na+-transporting ATPase subunit E
LGLEEIVSRIDQEAADRAAKILEDARADSSKVLDEAKTKADEIVSQARAQADREAKEDRQRSVASARLAAKREILQAKEDVLKRYEKGVMDSLGDFVKSDDYTKFLVKAIDQGLAKIGKDAVIRVNSRDKALLKGRKLGGELSKDSVECQGGALISSSDGKRRVDNTLESLLRDRSDALRLLLVEQVFGNQAKSGS